MMNPQDYAFFPSEERLINAYLCPKIAGQAVHGHASSVFHDADVCSNYPYELVREYAPALGQPATGHGDGRVWYFFSPVRYAGGTKRLRKVGPDGKGVWHSEGAPKKVKGSAVGTFQKFTYHEKTSSAIVKPGWLMTEYVVSQEDGDGDTVLCKIYKSHRGPGSDMPLRASASSGRKRKADVVEHLEAPPPRTPSLRPRKRTHEDHDDDMLFADSLERILSDDHAAPAYQESEHMSGGEPAAPAYQVQETDHMSGGGEPVASAFQETEHVPGGEAQAQLEPGASDLSVLPWLREFMESDDDKMAVQLPHDFSYERYLLGDDQLARAELPSAAQPEDATVTCVQMSQHGTPEEEELIEFSLDELMGSSPPGECSDLPGPLTHDDDEDVMVCGLACPPMDDAYVEQLLSAPPQLSDPAYVKEFFSDL